MAETRPTMKMKNFIGQIMLLTGIVLFIIGMIYAPAAGETLTREIGDQEVVVNNTIGYSISWQKFLGGMVAVIGIIVWAVRPNRDYSL
jgi:hypothetical protein